MRYFLRLSYNGSGFHGWQIQPSDISVQETLENALSRLLRRETPIVGAGRTDAGVNARNMYAHFDTVTPIEDKKRFIHSINALSGYGIEVYDLLEVNDDAHARFDAVSREYRYFISSHRDPFLRDISWHSPTPLNYKAMNQAAALLLNTDDFTSFAKLHSDSKTNICHVTKAEWHNEIIYGQIISVFTIKADRFLRNMVRSVVGTLIEVGRNKISIPEFQEIIDKKDRCSAGTSMPGNALFLWDVSYPDKIFKV